MSAESLADIVRWLLKSAVLLLLGLLMLISAYGAATWGTLGFIGGTINLAFCGALMALILRGNSGKYLARIVILFILVTGGSLAWRAMRGDQWRKLNCTVLAGDGAELELFEKHYWDPSVPGTERHVMLARRSGERVEQAELGMIYTPCDYYSIYSLAADLEGKPLSGYGLECQADQWYRDLPIKEERIPGNLSKYIEIVDGETMKPLSELCKTNQACQGMRPHAETLLGVFSIRAGHPPCR